METSTFYKVYGATEAGENLTQIGKKNWLLTFGYFKDKDNLNAAWHYRKNYSHKPSEEELKKDLETLINSITDQSILNGFVWNNIPVYLSTENQINFKAVYDLTVQTSGKTLPIRFKLGEDSDGNAVYYNFTDIDTFTDFYSKAVTYITDCINAGWVKKDSINYNKLLGNE